MPFDPTSYYYPTPARYSGGGGGRTLADLGGDSIANLIMAGGNAQADAYRRSGDMWGNTLAGIGQNLSGAIMEGAKKDEESKVQDAIRLAGSSQYPSATMPKEGTSQAADPGSGHIQAILDSLPPDVRPRALKGIQDAQTTATAFQEKQATLAKLQGEVEKQQREAQQALMEHWGTAAYNLHNHLADPDGGIGAAQFALQFSDAAKVPGGDKFAPMVQQGLQAYQQAQQSGDPAKVAAVVDAWKQQVAPLLDQGIASLSPERLKALDEVSKVKTREVKIQNADGSITTQIVEDKPGQTFAGAAKPPEAGSFEAYVVSKYGRNPTPEQQATARQDWAEAGRPKSEDTAVELTGPALDMTAEAFAKTFQLPPMGMGTKAAAARAKIINRAAELHPELDLAGAAASYKADAASLKGLQKQTDAVSAFESTASKNAALLDDILKTVPDTGTSLLNRPLRALEGKLGSEQITKLNAMRQSVQNEYSRIISNPNLSGTMSDSARKEGEALLDGGLTLGQFRAALSTLAAEAKNRHDSYNAEIDAIKGRMGGKKGTTGPPPPTSRPRATNPQTGAVVEWDGSSWVPVK